MDLDELLADLQSALPPEQDVATPSPNGRRRDSDLDGLYDHVEENFPSERASVASTPFDDVQYSEVRKGPLYVPGQGAPKSPSPLSPPPPRESLGTSAGLSELDSLLEMLSDSKIEAEIAASAAPGASSRSDPQNTRDTVALLVDELTQIEQQVGGKSDQEDSWESPKDGLKEREGKRPNFTASTATLELDKLMQHLEEFEPPPQQSSVGYVDKKPKNAMDNLMDELGSLTSDMENVHGVSTEAKGVCAGCKKPILGKVLDAMGKQWHPEHFACATCEIELGDVTFYESNGKAYCEKDYHALFAPRCAYCNGPIHERVMRALNKTWHPEHFFCTLCGKHFGPEGFHEKDGKAFCRECYYEKYAPRCKRCNKAIMEGFITALNAQWHPECFSCKVCLVTFPRGNYYEHEGEPHCEIHYHASRGTLCASCQKPVTGKCITAMGRKWHPEHFTCAFCLKLLNKGTFKEHRHNPYCQPCYIKLFG